jgi:cold shock CspA family protein
MGAINTKHDGAGGSITLSSDGSDLLVGSQKVIKASITSLATGQTVVFNGTDWVNQTPSGGGTTTESISSFLLMGA